jgi:integrase
MMKYEQEVVPYKASTTQKTERAIRQYFGQKLGQMILKDITASMVNVCITEVMKTHKPSTSKHYFAVINAVMNQCVEWDLLQANPLQKMKRIKLRDTRIRFLSAYERKILLQACKASSNKHLYPFVVLCLDVGLRREECRSLRWEDVDLATQQIVIYNRKNNKNISLPISDFAMEVLFEYHQLRGEDPQFVEKHKDTDYVFKSRIGTKATIRKAWYRVMKETGLGETGVHLHTLRHSCAADLLDNGASLRHVQELLGHKHIQSTMVYSHLQEGSIREVVQKASRKFEI